MIDMASVYAERYKTQPQMLQAAVMGQSPDPKLDPYTALNALKLVKESQMMAMAGRAQQPTSSPSIVAEALAPAPSAQGLGAMVPNTMGQMAPGAQQGLAAMAPQQRAPAPQAPMQAASGGLAGMYTPEEDFAEGGIVAFSGPTEANNNSLTTSDDYEMSTPAVDADPMALMQALLGEGTPEGYAAAQKIANERLDELSKFKRKEFDQEGFIKRYMDRVKKEGGPDLYAPEIARSAEDEADRARARRVGEAGAYFTAAGKILKGRTLAEGASEALPSFGTAMSEVEKADQAAKVANARYQFALKDAQRKERMGDLRGAQAAAELARKYELDANKAEFDRLRYGADIAVRNVQANRPLRGAGAGTGEAKLPQVDRDAASIAKQIVDIKAKDPNDPRIPGLTAKLKELKEIIAATKTSESGPGKLGVQESQIFTNASKDASATARKRLNVDPVMRSNDPAAMNKRYKELYAEEIQNRFPKVALSDLLAQMPAEELGSVTAPAAGKPSAQKALPMPASKDQLKVNQLYNTSQGLAVWNGTNFVAQ